MRLNRYQIELVSKYFADLSKIIIASVVIGYFIPSPEAVVTRAVFVTGIFLALFCVAIGVLLSSKQE